MWVLEARKDAEKIWFPVVWEERKDASDVVDYSINEEITKDASWIINANNQTTTGVATVIPWINAPKLIAETSITWLPEEEWSYYGNCEAVLSVWMITIPPWTTPDYSSKELFSYSCTLPFDFDFNGKWLVFPKSWWYEIEVTYYSTWQSEFTRYDNLYLNNTVIWTNSGRSSYTDTIQLNIKKWDVIWFSTRVHNSFPSTTVSKQILIKLIITPK